MNENDSNYFISYYKILNLPVPFKRDQYSDAQIKSAYRRRVLILHPDKSKTSSTAKLFNLLQTAYNELKELKNRQYYDNLLFIEKRSNNSNEELINNRKLFFASKLLKKEDNYKKKRNYDDALNAKEFKDRLESILDSLKSGNEESDVLISSSDEDEQIINSLRNYIRKRDNKILDSKSELDKLNYLNINSSIEISE